MTIITVISQQPLTTEQVNSFRSVPQGINLTASGDGLSFLSNDGTYKLVSGSGSTNLSIANKTSTTFDILSSSGTDVTLPEASITEAGLLVATDKVKLNSLGTASYLNVPASGNAASGEIVKGDDTRLTDARTPLSHSHAISDVTGLQTTLDGKFNNPTGDTTQYIAGDGSLVAFPIAGQAGTLVRQVRNETGSTLTKGTVIYLSGASGNKPLAQRAIANSELASDRTFGVVQADIINNSNGYCVVNGDLGGLNTSTLTEGAILYLSDTVAGGVTTTAPLAPNHAVVLGIVTRSHATQGQFDVSIQNGFELDDLHDLSISSVVNKDVLSYESSTGLWKNKQLATSDVVGLDTALGGKQPLDTVLTNTTASFTTALETKLNGIATGATANSSDATLLSRANHTGTQLASTISDFNTAADARVVAGITGKEDTIAAGTIAQYWRGDKSWQTLDKTTVGLSNVDNTSDTNKPISTATQTALNLKYDASNPSGYTTNLGTVTTFSFTNGGGFTGTVSTAGTTPTLSLTLQNATTSQSGQLTSTDWNTFNGKQAALVSGTNIKTVNGNSLLGSGDIVTTITDGDKGDITVSSSGSTWVIDNSAVTQEKLLNTDFSNLYPDANMLYISTLTGATIDTIATASTLAGASVNRVRLTTPTTAQSTVETSSDHRWKVEPNAPYQITWYMGSSNLVTLQLDAYIDWYSSSSGVDSLASSSLIGTHNSALGMTEYTNSVTAPSNARKAGIRFVQAAGAGAAQMSFGGIVVRRMSSTKLLQDAAVTNAKLSQVPTATFKGRITASTGAVEDLTASQATSLLDTFTTSTKGLVGASGGGTTNFLRADGTWAAPAGGGGGLTLTEFEVDFGTKPIRSKKFTITAAGVSGSSKVIVSPSGNVATGRVGDDWEWDSISTSAKAGTGQFTLTCFASGKVAGKRKFYYTYS